MRRNRVTALLSLFVIPMVLALALPAHATMQTGKIAGTVFDPDGVPLAGVTVTITSPDLMGKRQIPTAEDGSFLLFGLPPGKYKLTIEQPGFLPFTQENLRVNIGGTVSLDILLELPTAEETVVVTAKRPVVDTEKTSLGENYDEEFLQSVPVSQSYQSVAELAPGVYDAGSGNPNVHGSTLDNNQFLVDGVNTTDPVTSTFSANFNYDAIKEVQVLTGGLDAEYGQATGGIINLVTKSGGNEFELDASIYMRPDALILRDDFEKDGAPSVNAYNGNINVGGPIIKDKLWYFASVELSSRVSSIAAHPDYLNPANPENVKNPARDWLSVYYLGKLTYQMTDKHKLTVMTQGDPTWLENEVQSQFRSAEAERQRFQGGAFYMATWEALWTKNLFQKTMLALKDSRLHIYPQSGCTDVNNPDCRQHYDSNSGIYYGNDSTDVDIYRYRLQFDSSWTYYLDGLLGDHELKAGWQYSHQWEDSSESIPGGATYTDRSGQPYRISQLVPDDNGNLHGLNTLLFGDIMSIYLQDAWKITKTLTVKPGVRFDYSQMLNYKGKTITNFITTSPRLNVVWDMLGDGKTVVRGGYNRYVNTGRLGVAGFVGKSLETETYSYNPATGKYDIFEYSSGGDDGVVVKDNLTAPHTDEINLGIERELFTDFSVTLNGIYREQKYLFEDDDANAIWNQNGTQIIGYRDGEERSIWSLGTPREAWHRYWAIEMILRKNFSDNWQMNGSYTYSRAEGLPDYDAGGGIYTVTGDLDIPPQRKWEWGWLPYDHRHIIKLQGSYLFPYDVGLGATVTWLTGGPYSKSVFNDQYAGYYNVEYVRGYDIDHPDNPYWNRVPDTMSINVKISWDLQKLTGQNIDLIGEILNVLHLRDKTGLETRDLPPTAPTQYGQWTSQRGGLAAALGLRYRY